MELSINTLYRFYNQSIVVLTAPKSTFNSGTDFQWSNFPPSISVSVATNASADAPQAAPATALSKRLSSIRASCLTPTFG
jgi:hypothetical protein